VTNRYLLKVCQTWRREREELAVKLKKNLWYHFDMAHMFQDTSSMEHILHFSKNTEVGNRMKEKEREERDEGRDGVNGWAELMEHPWEEDEEGVERNDEEEEEEELLACNGESQAHNVLKGS
jgi:hypothetical protein